MAKINLNAPRIEQVVLNANPIIIVDTKSEKGYKTVDGFREFGSIFMSIYNDFIVPPDKDFDYDMDSFFSGVTPEEIKKYITTGELTSDFLKKIEANAEILPFRIGVYENGPALCYAGLSKDLFLYDLLMIKQHDIKIRLCEDCGKAFIPKTNGIYCTHCRDIHIRRKDKYEKLKADPVRLKYTRLQQRIQKREPILSPYKKWFENLAVDNKTESWLNEMVELDKRYKSVKRNYISCGFSSAEKEWDEKFKRANLATLDDLKVWLDDIANYRS